MLRLRRLRPSRRAFTQNAVERKRLEPRFSGAAGEQSLIYRAADDHWWLCCPCRSCGGVSLPLRARPDPRDLTGDVARLDLSVRTDGCPGCETRRNRSRVSMSRPSVWYDTVLRDWVVQLPWIGPGDGAILPLEIRWFDAPLASVYRAAGDLAFSGDQFEQSSSD
jgi:hypothetical protein